MNEESKIDLVVIKTICKTLLAIFVVVGFVFVSVCAINPKAASNYVSKNAQAVLLEKTYRKSGQVVDLYNAIEMNLSTEKYYTASKLIEEMKERDDYSEFCAKVNQSAIAQTTQKSRLVLVADYDSYLTSQLVKSYYLSNFTDKAETLASKELTTNSNIYDWCFGTYVDCVASDKLLTQEERQKALNDIYIKLYNNLSIDQAINNNVNAVGNPETLSGLEKCMAYYQIIRIRKTQRILMYANGQDINTITEEIETLIDKYEDSVAALTL
ncbi:MAG: hypothetical protein K6F08_02285 [bacterium]|nr:hypothetical protein [bacterium]